MGGEGLSSLSGAGSALPCWPRERGLAVVCVGGGWGDWGVVEVSVLSVGGRVLGQGGAGGESLEVTPLVVGWACVGVVLDWSLGFPPGLVGGVCVCRDGLAAPGWTQ